MKYSLVIATRNRAPVLRETLDCLAALQSPDPWEVVVVDNNSTDDTADTVRRMAAAYPAPLRCVYEAEPGRCAALNAGIANSRGEIILTPDDDVRVEPDWLTIAGGALERLGCDYVGGRVFPIWQGPRPDWLLNRTSRAWAVVALSDEGAEPFEYGAKTPLGANVAIRRTAFDIVGPWDTRLGRKAGTLLGQEVREWCIRARARGVRGHYVPQMTMGHIIPTSRLRKSYFRRWFYWRGISRALLYQQAGLNMQRPEDTSIDFSQVAHLAGVPRYMFRQLLEEGSGMVRELLRGNRSDAFEHELWVFMFAGILRQRWRDRRVPVQWSGTVAPGPQAAAR